MDAEVNCPVKGLQSVHKCAWWRRRGLKACQTCDLDRRARREYRKVGPQKRHER